MCVLRRLPRRSPERIPARLGTPAPTAALHLPTTLMGSYVFVQRFLLFAAAVVLFFVQEVHAPALLFHLVLRYRLLLVTQRLTIILVAPKSLFTNNKFRRLGKETILC